MISAADLDGEEAQIYEDGVAQEETTSRNEDGITK